MTVRDAYEACLIELNKVQAPSLLVDDFVYLLNRSIQEYFNQKYNNFEKIQQSTDDLRQLIRYEELFPTLSISVLDGAKEFELPADYVHMLGCRAIFQVPSDGKCDSCAVKTEIVGVNKLDTNQFPHIMENYYMKPAKSRPYYQIINIANPVDSSNLIGIANSEKQANTRYGNAYKSTIQILCGNDINKLQKIQIQYLSAPVYVTLTQDDLDTIEDNTQQLEFSDYICNEIIKKLVTSILENQQNPRIQTYNPVNQSVPQ